MSDADQPGGGSFFSAFANAMIERSLPAIREWLRTRLGARASLGEVSVEGVRVTVKNSRIPLGAAVMLAVDEATLLARPDNLMGGRAPAHLERLRGVLRFERGPLTTLEAPVEIEGRAGGGDAWVDGTVRIAGATWQPTRGVGEAVPLQGTAELRITAEAWSVRQMKLTSGGCTIGGWASGALGGEVLRSGEIEVDAARLGHMLDVLEAFSGRALPMPLPITLDARLDVKAALGTERLVGTVELKTERSDARLSFERASGVIKNGELTARVHPEELLPETWRRFVVPDACSEVTLDAKVEGPLAALEGTARASAERWQLVGQRNVSPAKLLVALRGKDGLDFDLGLDGAARLWGHATPDLLGGHAELLLEPRAVAIGERTIGGDALSAHFTLDAGRLEAKLDGPRVELRRGDRPPLLLKRVRGQAALVDGKASGLKLTARVGPGRARITQSGDATRVQLDRLDRDDGVAVLDLLFSRRFVGASREHARFAIPEGTEAWADVTVAQGALEGIVHVEGTRSRLSFAPLKIDLRTGATDGTTVRAILSWIDARPIGLVGEGLGPVGPGAAQLTATLSGVRRGMRLFVSGHASEIGLGTDPELPPDFVAEHVATRFSVGADGIELQELSADVFGGRLEARGALAGRALRLERARWEARGPKLRGLLLPDPSVDALTGLEVDLELSGTQEALEGELSVRTDRSRLALTVRTEDQRFDEARSRVLGSVDLVDLGALLAPFDLSADAPIDLEGAISGEWTDPRATLSLRGGEGRLGLETPDSYRTLSFTGLEADAELARAGSSVRATLAGLGGGSARFEAAVLTARPAVGTIGTLELEDVQVAQASPEVQGRLSTRASFWRLAGLSSGVRASVALLQPRYPILGRLAPLLDRYGLEPPSPEGVGPATARLRLERGALSISELDVAVNGVRVSGAGGRSADGEWSGEVRVEAKEGWLKTSELLRTPASWLGDLVVPLRLEGVGPAPRIRADVLAALDRAIGGTSFGRGVQGAIDRVLEQLFTRPLQPPAPPAPHHEAEDVTTSDALIDRVASGAPDADHALATLLERGASPRELAAQITRRRVRDP